MNDYIHVDEDIPSALYKLKDIIVCSLILLSTLISYVLSINVFLFNKLLCVYHMKAMFKFLWIFCFMSGTFLTFSVNPYRTHDMFNTFA